MGFSPRLSYFLSKEQTSCVERRKKNVPESEDHCLFQRTSVSNTKFNEKVEVTTRDCIKNIQI